VEGSGLCLSSWRYWGNSSRTSVARPTRGVRRGYAPRFEHARSDAAVTLSVISCTDKSVRTQHDKTVSLRNWKKLALINREKECCTFQIKLPTRVICCHETILLLLLLLLLLLPLLLFITKSVYPSGSPFTVVHLFVFRQVNSQVVVLVSNVFHPKLATHLHLLPRLRMRGAIPPLPQYVFMVWCLIKQDIRLWAVVLS